MAKQKNQEKTAPIENFEAQDYGDEAPDYGEIYAAWEFPEHIKYERGSKWYLTTGIILLALVFLSIYGLNFTMFHLAGQAFTLSFDRNPLFVILLVLFIIVYLYIERKDINNIQIMITEDGVVLNDKLIEYKDLDNFYIIYYPPQIKNLYLRPKNLLRPMIIIPLENESPVIIRQALLHYLTEDLSKEEMPAHEAISNRLKL
ncbi:MAG: hypothetical protein WC465_02750 [Patescibacteria group bacterium]